MSFVDAARKSARNYYPGTICCLLAAMAAYTIQERTSLPLMLVALLMGSAVRFLGELARCESGLELTSSTLLRAGVGLLGIQISFREFLDFGFLALVGVTVSVASSIGVGLLLARLLGLDRRLGVLTGCSVGICGASAALAVASALPRYQEINRHLAFTVVSVTVISTVAMVLYPTIAELSDLSDNQAGFLFGATIHDVAQVVGAAHIYSTAAVGVAATTKLFRVALLVPVVFLISRAYAGEGHGGPIRVPQFMVIFIVLALLNSLSVVPAFVREQGMQVSQFLLVMAIVAMGTKVGLQGLVPFGWRPFVVVLLETLVVLTLGCLLVFLLWPV